MLNVDLCLRRRIRKNSRVLSEDIRLIPNLQLFPCKTPPDSPWNIPSTVRQTRLSLFLSNKSSKQSSFIRKLGFNRRIYYFQLLQDQSRYNCTNSTISAEINIWTTVQIMEIETPAQSTAVKLCLVLLHVGLQIIGFCLLFGK